MPKYQRPIDVPPPAATLRHLPDWASADEGVAARHARGLCGGKPRTVDGDEPSYEREDRDGDPAELRF